MSDIYAQYRQDLEQLRNYVSAGPRGLRKMNAAEIRQFDALYRRLSILLAQVNTRLDDPGFARHLNDLVGRAHILFVSAGTRRGPMRISTVMFQFPKVVARTLRFHLMAAGLFFFGALMAFVAVHLDPVAAYAIMPQGETRLPGAAADQLLDALRHGRGQSDEEKFAFASFLFGNNTRVGMLSMASGLAAGVPTVFLTIYNGMILGAFTATHSLAAIHAEYWAWILPHGVPEIGALILMSGMGLRLGQAFLAPGRRTRTSSLQIAGNEAMVVLLGSAALLFFAALIESYVRQSHLPTEARFAVAGGGALLLGIYFFTGWMLERATRAFSI